MNIEEKIIGTTCYVDESALTSGAFLSFLLLNKEILAKNMVKLHIPKTIKDCYNNLNANTNDADFEKKYLATNNLEVLNKYEIVKYFGIPNEEPNFCFAKQIVSSLGTQKISFITSDSSIAREFEEFNTLIKLPEDKNVEVIDLQKIWLSI